MAKFIKSGYIGRSKKDPNKFNLVMEENGVKSFYILKAKPSEEEVAANPRLSKVAEGWPEWKKFEVVKMVDE